MNFNISDLKKKILYRSNYRGTKEMDTLLGSFSKKYIDLLTNDELIELSDLLDLDDEILYKFNQGKIDFENENGVTELFKNFVYENF